MDSELHIFSQAESRTAAGEQMQEKCMDDLLNSGATWEIK